MRPDPALSQGESAVAVRCGSRAPSGPVAMRQPGAAARPWSQMSHRRIMTLPFSSSPVALLPARGVCLLAREVQRPHNRHVGMAEQDGWLFAGVDVLVEGPTWHTEHVFILPVEPLAVHDGGTRHF